jgi:hypothetical protein
MNKLISIELPKPHDQQEEVLNSSAKRAVIVAGRRAGKTTLAAIKSIRSAVKGQKVIYATPIAKQARTYWNRVVDLLAPAIQIGWIEKSETTRTLTFSNGGYIVCQTAHDPDSLRSDACDLLILDEYAYMNPDVWERVGAPMLLDRNGTAWFISTPVPKNHFYTMYLSALNNPGTWDVFHFSSLNNPFLSKEALNAMIEDMQSEHYKQEILAEFVKGEGQVFVMNAEDFIPYVFSEEHNNHRLVGGLDWGQKNDYTAFSIGCADCSKELRLFRVRGDDYPTQRERIKDILKHYTHIELLAESNSIGQPNIEQLRTDGVPVNGFITSNSSKAQIIQTLRLAFEQRSWKWLDDEVAWRELEAYEMKITPSGNITYGAPAGLNDDTIIARALMLRQATIGRFNLS